MSQAITPESGNDQVKLMVEVTDSRVWVQIGNVGVGFDKQNFVTLIEQTESFKYAAKLNTNMRPLTKSKLTPEAQQVWDKIEKPDVLSENFVRNEFKRRGLQFEGHNLSLRFKDGLVHVEHNESTKSHSAEIAIMKYLIKYDLIADDSNWLWDHSITQEQPGRSNLSAVLNDPFQFLCRTIKSYQRQEREDKYNTEHITGKLSGLQIGLQLIIDIAQELGITLTEYEPADDTL